MSVNHMRARRLLWLLVAVTMLAACGGSGGDSDAAARAVEEYLTAKAAGDRSAITRLLCTSMEADLDREALSFADLNARIEDMACASDAGTDTVTCSGAILVDYAGEARAFPLSTYRVVQEDGRWKWCGVAPSE
jgi:ABC-type glycerol-3-phosphate transport system substrate-binding protein